MTIEDKNYQGKKESGKSPENLPETPYKIHGFKEARDGKNKCLVFYLLNPKDRAAYGYSPSERKIFIMWPNADHFPNLKFHEAPQIPIGMKMATIKDLIYLDDAYRDWRDNNQKNPIKEFWKRKDVRVYIKALPNKEKLPFLSKFRSLFKNLLNSKKSPNDNEKYTNKMGYTWKPATQKDHERWRKQKENKDYIYKG